MLMTEQIDVDIISLSFVPWHCYFAHRLYAIQYTRVAHKIKV